MLYAFISAVRESSLATTYSIFMFAPLLVAALSVPILGEKVVGVHREAWVPEFSPRPFRRLDLGQLHRPLCGLGLLRGGGTGLLRGVLLLDGLGGRLGAVGEGHAFWVAAAACVEEGGQSVIAPARSAFVASRAGFSAPSGTPRAS